MSGAFHDSPIAPALTFTNTNIFQPPPHTPSAVKSLTKSSRPSYTRSSATHGSRKRARYAYDSESIFATPQQTPLNSWSELPSTQSSAYFSTVPSPAPFVNTKYEVAGGLDTPSAAMAAKFEEQDEQHDDEIQGFRSSRFHTPTGRVLDGYFPATPALGVEGAMRRKRRPSIPDKRGWGSNLVTTVGGIAWKGINYCFSSAFRGFYAGGGNGFAMTTTTPAHVEQVSWTEVDGKDDVFNGDYEGGHVHCSTPIPGQFPDEDFITDYMSCPESHRRSVSEAATPFPGGKNANTMKGSWIMVTGSETPSRETSPSRKVAKAITISHSRTNSRASIAGVRSKPGTTSRQSLISHAGSPALQPGQSASYASPRSPAQRAESDLHFRRSPSPTKARSSLASAGLSPRRSTAGKPTLTGSTHMSPEVQKLLTGSTHMSPEVQKLERKVRLKVKRDEESMTRFNKQLRDMIREGKEALATRVDVDSEDDDVGESEDEEGGYRERALGDGSGEE